MEKYKYLTETEVRKYQSLLDLPNIDFPHYEPFIKDGIV